MARSKDEVTVEFDHQLPVAEQDLDDKADELRATCPMGWSNHSDGFWFLTKHKDVRQSLLEYRTFSSVGGVSIPSFEFPPQIPLDVDPPIHKPYRLLLNPMLSRVEVAEKLAPRVDFWTTYFIDQFIEKGSCDLVYDLCIVVPAAVTLEWLGWSKMDEYRRISEAWHDLVSYPPGHPLLEQAYEGLAWLEERIVEELADRKAHPRDDRMTQIAEAEIAGEPITLEHATGVVRLALAGGVDTTGTLVASSLEHLDRHPEQRRQLMDDPGLWDGATEEFLRRYGPARTTARTVAQDGEWNGCKIGKGDRVLIGLTAANLDDEVFEDPREVVLDRHPNPHMSFGVGIHRCVGMHLARAEYKGVMRQVLQRLPDFALDRDRAVPHFAQPTNSGWSSLPATFTPGEKLG